MVKKIVLILITTMTLVVGVFITKPMIFTIISQNLNSSNGISNDNKSVKNDEQDTKQDIQEDKLDSNPVTSPIVSTPKQEPNPQAIPEGQPSNPKPTPAEQSKPAPQPVPVTPQPEVQEATRELEVLRLVNAERQKVGRKPLEYMSALEQGANIRALEIIDLWSHTRPDGTRFVTAFDYMQYAKLGENLASGSRTPKDVVSLWMKSDNHRQNILSENYESMAIAVSTNAEGRLYWVQVLYQGK